MTTVAATALGGPAIPIMPSFVTDAGSLVSGRVAQSFKGALPGISLAVLTAAAYPSLSRFVKREETDLSQGQLSDPFLQIGILLGVAAILAGAFFLSSRITIDGIGRFNPPNRLFPPGSTLWPNPPAGGMRTNQEIFDSVISRYFQKKPNSMNPFYMVDELLQEGGVRVRHEFIGFRSVQIIDMRGVHIKGLDLKSVKFSGGTYLPGSKENVFIDFSGSVFEDFKLTDGYFRNCLFDDVQMKGIHLIETPFDFCQFSGGTTISGTIETGGYGGYFGRCFFDDVHWESITLRNIRFDRCALQGNLFNRCIFKGVTFKGEAGDKFHHIKNSRFDRCQIQNTIFEWVSVSKSSFPGSLFYQTTFKNFRGIHVDFSSLPKTEEGWQTVFTECYFGLDSHFTRCHFRNSLMSGTKISSLLPQDQDARSLGILFEDCDFAGFQFVNDPRSVKSGFVAQLMGTEFRRCQFPEAVFDPAVEFGDLRASLIIDTCDFTRARFSERRTQGFFGATILRDRVIWRGWNNLEEVHWEGVKLADVPHGIFGMEIEGNFTRGYLEGADLYQVNLGQSLIDQIILRGASCQKTVFSRCRSVYTARVDTRTGLWKSLLPRYLIDSPIKREGQKQGAQFV